MNRVRLAVLMTCHNRKNKTLASLEHLYRQNVPGWRPDVYLVDDGSTDGTGEAVMRAYPGVYILHGTGNLFWNGGMRLAFAEALRNDYDLYLWLNDDTLLYPNAVQVLLRSHDALSQHDGRNVIVVGSVQDPVTGQHTYGGVVRQVRWHPLRFSPVLPSERDPRPCETFNGNCVLIPRAVAKKVGNLDGTFTHGMGDFDYGLRARRLGVEVWVAPGYVGTCPRNSRTNTWADPKLSLRERWERIRHPKGLPPLEWMVMARRHGGLAWVLFWVMPYARVLIKSLRARSFTVRARGSGG